MAKKNPKMSRKEIKDEMEAIKKLKNVASILNADEMENAFLLGTSSATESMDDSVAGNVLNNLHGKNIGVERLERMEAEAEKRTARGRKKKQNKKKNGKAKKEKPKGKNTVRKVRRK